MVPYARLSNTFTLCGYLRRSGISEFDGWSELLIGRVQQGPPRIVLRARRDALEEFAVAIHGNGMHISTLRIYLHPYSILMGRPGIIEPGGFTLGQNTVLRRFALRARFADLSNLLFLRKVPKAILSSMFSNIWDTERYAHLSQPAAILRILGECR